ncbi:PIF1-like helicase domain-containing protein [Hirsutella rhossiliensis]|uniref:ATP-dependent DNA helicase n=1 Tax=Hirsutella rhossiliensis TaxID=111463 RepID=A0A9P8MNS6_9HYPO|nr:PIF1-like helicase domain-containing protein [Hirsutella rhossiliensis]KAH0958868.1 PIF1-like helicase domain-containing protein [Hirsutella rhossiliensis]
MRKEGRSYFVFEAARNDSLMNHFNPAIVLGWLANIDISPAPAYRRLLRRYADGGVRRLPPVEHHARSYRVDDDVNETVGSYQKYLERNGQHERVTYLEYLQSYNLKTWRILSVRIFAAAYQYCRQQHHSHEDDHYGEPGAKELRAEDDQFELEEHVDPVVEEDWHELARMLPDHPLGEEDIDILGRRDLDRLVYDTVMDHFLTQHASQLLLHVDGGGGTGKSYLINILSAHLQAAAGGRGTPVWRAAPTGVAGNQISGTTLHSLLHLPINKDFKPLLAIDKAQLQKKLKDVKYLIIDEKSMLGLRQLSWIDDRLREAFPNRNEEFFGGLNILEVNEFNHYHLDRLGRPVIQVMAKNVGPGAAAAPDDKPVGLCNGARGTVHDIGWAPGADPIQDPPCVIMMEFDKYSGPVFLTTPDGRKISQSITEDMVVTDLSCRDFQTGLSYVAVSRVKTLQGLMLDAPFDRNHLTYASPPEGIKMKMRDQEIRRRQVLTRNPYETYHGPA